MPIMTDVSSQTHLYNLAGASATAADACTQTDSQVSPATPRPAKKVRISEASTGTPASSSSPSTSSVSAASPADHEEARGAIGPFYVPVLFSWARGEAAGFVPLKDEAADFTPRKSEVADFTPQKSEVADFTPQKSEVADFTPQKREVAELTPQKSEGADTPVGEEGFEVGLICDASAESPGHAVHVDAPQTEATALRTFLHELPPDECEFFDFPSVDVEFRQDTFSGVDQDGRLRLFRVMREADAAEEARHIHRNASFNVDEAIVGGGLGNYMPQFGGLSSAIIREMEPWRSSNDELPEWYEDGLDGLIHGFYIYEVAVGEEAVSE